MSYRVEFTAAAARGWRDLAQQAKERLGAAVSALAESPRPPGSAALRGDLQGLFRLRVGDWRIVYEVDEAARLVTVTELAHRSKVYKRARR